MLPMRSFSNLQRSSMDTPSLNRSFNSISIRQRYSQLRGHEVEHNFTTFARILPLGANKKGDAMFASLLSSDGVTTPGVPYEVYTKKNKTSKMLRVLPFESAVPIESTMYCRDSYDLPFHDIFGEDVCQEEVFKSACLEPVLNKFVLQGYNACIFCYGQTGSGKTYTMCGDGNSFETRGLIPRCLEFIFDYKRRQQDDEIKIFASYVEIYNESVYDLIRFDGLDEHSLDSVAKVTLHDDANGNLCLKNLSKREILNDDEAIQLLLLGYSNRIMSETSTNERSSRSHCIFTIEVERIVKSTQVRRLGKLHLVDLAGSERAWKAGLTSRDLHESKYINKSLHFLEQVVAALYEKKGGRRSHIPYRNSALTSILRDSRRKLFAQRCSRLSNYISVNETIPLLTRKFEHDKLKFENQQLLNRLREVETTRESTLDEEPRESTLDEQPINEELNTSDITILDKSTSNRLAIFLWKRFTEQVLAAESPRLHYKTFTFGEEEKRDAPPVKVGWQKHSLNEDQASFHDLRHFAKSPAPLKGKDSTMNDKSTFNYILTPRTRFHSCSAIKSVLSPPVSIKISPPTTTVATTSVKQTLLDYGSRFNLALKPRSERSALLERLSSQELDITYSHIGELCAMIQVLIAKRNQLEAENERLAFAQQATDISLDDDHDNNSASRATLASTVIISKNEKNSLKSPVRCSTERKSPTNGIKSPMKNEGLSDRKSPIKDGRRVREDIVHIPASIFTHADLAIARRKASDLRGQILNEAVVYYPNDDSFSLNGKDENQGVDKSINHHSSPTNFEFVKSNDDNGCDVVEFFNNPMDEITKFEFNSKKVDQFNCKKVDEFNIKKVDEFAFSELSRPVFPSPTVSIPSVIPDERRHDDYVDDNIYDFDSVNISYDTPIEEEEQVADKTDSRSTNASTTAKKLNLDANSFTSVKM